MSLKLRQPTRRGDTLIEVAIAIVIFCLISTLAIGLMDRDLATVQGSLELTMARNEIDAQAEALRFIHNSYLSERELKSSERQFEGLWFALSRSVSGGANSGLANNPADISKFEAVTCRAYYDDAAADNAGTHTIYNDNAFIINTRNIDSSNPSATIIKAKTDDNRKYFQYPTLYPRVIFSSSKGSSSDQNSDQMAETSVTESSTYDQIARVEGLWVIAARDAREGLDVTNLNSSDTPQFFDFHIRACWYAPGNDTPTTIATIIRLYNPELVEEARTNV